MKNYAFARTILGVVVLFASTINVQAQEAPVKKPIILPWNYKQIVREAQESDARITKEAGVKIEEGIQLVKQRKVDAALVAFRKADDLYKTTKFCTDHNTRVFIPPALVKAGRNQEAIAAYRALYYQQSAMGEMTHELDNIDGRSLMEFALLLYQAGQYEEARLIYEKGLLAVNLAVSPYGPSLEEHFEPGNANPKRFLAAVYAGLGLVASHDSFLPLPEEGKVNPATDAEFNYYQKALKLYPTFALAHYYLAGITSARNAQLGRTGPAVWQETTDEYKKAAQYGRGEVKAAAEKHVH